MTTMINQLKRWLTDNLPKVPHADSKRAMRYVSWYAWTLVFTVVLYLGAWGWDTFTTRKPNLQELRAFITVLASSPWVAAIGFAAQGIAGKLYKENNHGQNLPMDNQKPKTG